MMHLFLPKRALTFLALSALATLALPLRAIPLQGYTGYTVSNLVSDLAIDSTNVDLNLINPWGLTFDLSGDPIVADNGLSLVSFYGPDGTIVPFTITAGTSPTGVEYNSSSNEFNIGTATNPAAAELLICTKTGTILGFSLEVNFNAAVVAVDDSASGAVFTGMTLARIRGKQYIYAADFHNGEIKIYNDSFAPAGSFTDPKVGAGFAPFNVRNIGGFLFVTFAKQNGMAATNDLAGAGNGFVEIFTPEGFLVRRLISRGELNSPWGITFVPFNFGALGGTLLVGNHGDGHINAYDLLGGRFLGALEDSSDKVITIPGLWSLKMTPSLDAEGNDDCDNPADNTLYFTAGPNNGTDGILGVIQSPKGRRNIQMWK